MTVSENFKAVLRERAGRLSHPIVEPPKDLKRIVIFNVGREVYGLEITQVVEIVRPESITHVPGADEHIEGITNLRGDIVTVVDLKGMLTGEPRNEDQERGQMIIGDVKGNKLGMLVTSVDGIYDIQTTLIDPPLATLDKLMAEHLLGEFKFGDRIVGLLNAAGVLETKGL